MRAEHPLSVYFFAGCRAGTTFEYRVLQKQEQLALYGIESIAQQDLSYDTETLGQALAHDIIYLYRVAYSPFIEEVIHQARARSIPVVFGVDDLVFDPDVAELVDPVKSMPHEQAAHYYQGTWRFRRTLMASDYAVASTDFLANIVRAYGKRTFVHRNGLSQWMVDESERLIARRQGQPKSDIVVIGYGSGTATHRQDLAEAADALATVMARHPNVELHVAGSLHAQDPMALPDKLKVFGGRVKHLPQVEWKEYLSVLNTSDINLAPLESGNPFCDGKSEIKYTEAALLGLPTVSSRIGAYEHAIRDGETGFVAGDSEEWTAKLERLVVDEGLRHRMGEAARTDVLERYSPQALGRELVQMLETIRELHAEQRKATLHAAPDPRATPLVLNWVVSEPTPGSGGHTDIIRMINLLASYGHQINTYIVPRERLADKSDLEIREYVRRNFADLSGPVFKWADGSMVESDGVVLTHWTTAYEIEDTRNTSQVFYFVQDWEPFFSPMGPDYLRAEQTYKMGFSCITLGRWLTEYLSSKYGAEADYFDFAVDHEIYFPRKVSKPDRPRVCFYARPATPRRLFPLGIEALDLLYQRRPDVEIVFYGVKDEDLRFGHDIPFPYTNLGILKEHELAELFSSCHVGVVLSPTNCSLVPPEMMACKCPVVDLNRETVRWVLEHEVNALLAEPTPEGIAGAAVRLLEDEPLRQRLIDRAYQQVQELSWAKSARKVEEILYQRLPESRRALARYRFKPLPPLPSLADLPAKQQEHLNGIHSIRRRVSARWMTRAKNAVKRVLRFDRGLGLNGKPIRKLGELTGKHSWGQSFVARHDNLHRIDVLVSAFGRQNTRDVVLHLKESPTAEGDLVTVRLNAGLLLDNSYASFEFEPLHNSRGRALHLCIESPESVPGDAIALWAHDQADVPSANLYRNGRARGGHLIFGLYYRDKQLGEIGERPFALRWDRINTSWSRLRTALQLVLSGDLARLRYEVMRYLLWKLQKP